MIRIVDYGIGNIQAFLTMYKRLGVDAKRASTPDELNDADKLILPGVGSFDHAMALLKSSGMKDKLEELVIQKKVPVLGICVGMQMLASSSEEGKLQGLNWIPGKVKSFASNPESVDLPLPHMGWNDVSVKKPDSVFNELTDDNRFYFLHSFYFEADYAEDVVATAEYGHEFACVVSRGHIYGIQCHPEKSHHFGAHFLKSFAEFGTC